ncbi:hypothetical protein EMIHUDRAFT_242941 [Emiliania huxleyi CCMP1516]|uniref:EamA domain-containing protein n=2 Tax=Emiliania huxleyi TaxID=2903 RepID=A0A0D3J741_EMIH1|nr:hypothetical protein EMIHUDRAFT_242941 [Emiliania huxleyi CCMP1516]EOD19326.1 hypothetical protein EMIHUDRAFT_242941 [Emiliania huxleyi CCMP1516]|eukprot:XP_005771755.1 hypothetical protein EMIHUDRAFT_242941 [Emiliania huxleyi CCMP1516]
MPLLASKKDNAASAAAHHPISAHHNPSAVTVSHLAGPYRAPVPPSLSEVEIQELRKQTRQCMLAVGMFLSGTANTITIKAAMSTLAVGRDGGDPRPFDHPFVVAGFMFVGEISCLLVHYMTRARGCRKRYNTNVCALPAMFDISATCIMYRRLWPFHWCALFSVCVGAAVVGYASLLVAPAEAGGASPADGEHGLWQRLRGDALVVVSQLFVATQMCIEERFVTGHDMPALLTVGCEGLWGLFGLFVLLAHTPGAHGHPVEDTIDALAQIHNSPRVLAFLVANACSIAASAAYRMVLDSMRTIGVWAFGLAFAGESFHPLQLVGFAFLALGAMLYNEAVALPCSAAYPSERQREEDKARLAERRLVSASRSSGRLSSAEECHASADYRLYELSDAEAGGERLFDDFFTPHLSRWTAHFNR